MRKFAGKTANIQENRQVFEGRLKRLERECMSSKEYKAEPQPELTEGHLVSNWISTSCQGHIWTRSEDGACLKRNSHLNMAF